MKTPSDSCRLFTRLVFGIGFAIALLAFAVTAEAAKGSNNGNGGGGGFSCSITADQSPIAPGVAVNFTGTASGGKPPYTVAWTIPNTTNNVTGTNTLTPGPAIFGDNPTGTQQTVLLQVTETASNPKTCTASWNVVYGEPIARGDTYATPIGKTLSVQAARVSGLLYNDFDTNAATGKNIGNTGLTVVKDSDPSGTLTLSSDGSFTYDPPSGAMDNGNDSFTYHVRDANGNNSKVATVNIHLTANQTDFKILMNYELGMHCTGFEFSYCCVLPPYNSILAQVVKPQTNPTPASNADFPRLLTADPNNGLDGLGRETLLRDYDDAGNIKKYFLEYHHDAQPRREGNSPNNQASTQISAVEGNSMLYYNTPYDSAKVVNGKLQLGAYGGLSTNNVVQGDGDYTDPTDNFANGWLNHLYIYNDSVEGPNLEGNKAGTNHLESQKIRLGVVGQPILDVAFPVDCGATLQPMGPVTSDGQGINGDPNSSLLHPNDCGGFAGVPADNIPGNVLTFSGDTGTVVYTQMKVLEDLPIMLTSPRIWEATGLPLTPFEDTINFFADPGAIDENSIRPYVAMKVQMYDYPSGNATTDGEDNPVIGFGTAPIDIPNCERCHSAPAFKVSDGTPNVNSPSYVRRFSYTTRGKTLEALVNEEIDYWKAYYNLTAGDSDWYPRLKGAAISIELLHDYDNFTNFTANWPVADGQNPLGLPESKWVLPGGNTSDGPFLTQNTRMGHESVICQKCHADNVIAVVKSASVSGHLVRPISEAIHNAHRSVSEGGKIVLNDSIGRDGGCQGCHPAHRSDGVMDNYPITAGGDSANADGDNRLNQGGCFVGRDVHSNPLKDVELDIGLPGGTKQHLNAVGEWLKTNVSRGQAGQGNSNVDFRGIWCTNCHTQLSQEMWRTEDCNDLIHGDCVANPRGQATLGDVASAVGVSQDQAIAWLDPNNKQLHNSLGDFTHAVWDGQAYTDANVATIEVGPTAAACNPLIGVFNSPGVYVCVKTDGDGDPNVNILSFCTTNDCVTKINANKTDQTLWRYPEHGAVDGIDGFGATTNNTFGAPVPFSAADDARDHWLAPGEPHCADCHAAPYTEQSGNINPFPPFNYPAKAGLMRYSRGHQDISCQGCHESIHGLYPVSPAIDNTTYAQAAALNADGSHGPLKCGTCHVVVNDAPNGIPTWIGGLGGGNSGVIAGEIGGDFDKAVTWAHKYTDNTGVLNTTCQNCHGVNGDFSPGAFNTHSNAGDWGDVDSDEDAYLVHAQHGLISRQMMDKAETEALTHVIGANSGTERNELCSTCHTGGANKLGTVTCSTGWIQHLTQGRVSEAVWVDVSKSEPGTNPKTCGW